MTENNSFSVRPMAADDLGPALVLSCAEGWNQTEKDWKLLLENPGNICMVAEKDKKVAGTATAMVHSGKIAWIGMVIVDKALRGKGAGRMLLTHLTGRLKHIESIKLDATPAGYPLYQNLGFMDEYTIFRMTNPFLETSGYLQAEDVPGIISIDSAQDIFAKDKMIFGADRGYLLRKLIENYPEKAFHIKRGDITEGYILGRDGSRFNYIGPLCTDSLQSARSLISTSLRFLIKKPVALDVPEEKREFIKWLESIGFSKQRYFIRMYLNRNPYPGIPESQYLISGPEYG